DTFFYLKKAFQSFETLLGLEVSDNEIGFLVPIFQVALRNRIRQAKRILVVSSYKRNLINFLLARLEEEFLVEIVHVISMKQLDDFQKNVDLIITTSDLSQMNLKVPFCRVSPILTESDRKHLEEFELPPQDKHISLDALMNVIERNVEGQKCNTFKMREDLLQSFPNIVVDEKAQEIKENLVIQKYQITELDVFDWKEAVKAATEILWKHKYIKKAYMEDMLNHLEEDGLMFLLNENSALFYTEPKENVYHTGFSIVHVETPLIISGNKIEYFVCFAPKGDAEDQNLLFQLNDFFEEENFENTLKKMLRKK
ncbi:PTS sugar transporter subunit IIA, partial [Fusobacterium necrophorum]|nr:PTS sugar transporter subunit IIA [Fusobacterium necrophorum]